MSATLNPITLPAEKRLRHPLVQDARAFRIEIAQARCILQATQADATPEFPVGLARGYIPIQYELPDRWKEAIVASKRTARPT